MISGRGEMRETDRDREMSDRRGEILGSRLFDGQRIGSETVRSSDNLALRSVGMTDLIEFARSSPREIPPLFDQQAHVLHST